MESNANTDVDELITFGKMALEQGWYDQARQYFEHALALDASNREALKGLARVYERLSRKEAVGAEPIEGEPAEPPRPVARTRKRRWWILGLVVLGLFVCSVVTCLGISMFVFSPKATPTPVAAIPERVEPLATVTKEAAMGEFIIHEDVKTTVIEYELTDSYLTKSGTEEKPAEGAKFLWLHVKSENVGEVANDLPNASHFVLLYKDTRISPRWAWKGPQGYTMYEGEEVYPGIGREGWILYEIPVGADPAEIMVRFEATGGLFAEKYYLWRLEAK